MKLDDLKYHSIIGALKAVALLPLPALYLFSDFARWIMHRVLKYRVKVVRKNLKISFPEKSEKELRKIENDFYRHLCDTFIEAIKLLHISDRALKKRVILKDFDILEKEVTEKQSVILFMGHYGNWEWIPSLTLHADPSLLLGELYKPLRDKVMDRVMQRIRDRFSSEKIIHRTAYRTLLGYKRDKRRFIVGFIADQRPIGQPLHHWTMFLNQPTAYMAGGETIGDRIGSGFIYCEMCQNEKRGHYTLSFKKMKPDAKDTATYPYTRLYYQMLEESIRKSPAMWLWSHNRWKSTPPDDVEIISY